jgi:hypothetical protein
MDICASAAPDGRSILVTAVNRNSDHELPLSLVLSNFAPKFKAEVKMLLPHSFESTETQLVERKEAPALIGGNCVETELRPCAIARIVLSGTRGWNRE